MPLSWNEIKQRAVTFSREWSDATRERADAQTFWNEFFHVFGKSRRAVATFEEPVKNLGGNTDFIDLFWKGRLIGESKSRGKDLSKAHSQAVDYCQSLAREGREDELPRYVLVTDFERLAIHDLEPDKSSDLLDPTDAPPVTFPLSDLHEHIRRFAFIAGYETQTLDPEDPANIEAAELLANLHDTLEDGGYGDHDLQRFMVRILFCLFAEDTGIFEPDAFKRCLQNHTAEDGSDLGPHLARLFQTLNTPRDRRSDHLHEELNELPYVNGRLFEERLNIADFNRPMREALLRAAGFRWETISPAVFGSLFQSIMEPRARRQIGAHYTSERDIMKLIRSLFLDRLTERLNKCVAPRDFNAFLDRLRSLRFLDPACGCGNFLVIAFREVRRLEMEALNALSQRPGEGTLGLGQSQIPVSRFYGIEIEEWPALIAEVAMWLMDHQLNNEQFQRFGTATPTIPLKESPRIVNANALTTDWNTVLSADQCSYVMGNPPFIGSKYQTAQQRAEVRDVWGDVKRVGTLDYVSAWHAKATDYMAGHACRASLVSTNSITQGEQVGVIWPELFKQGIKIDHAHRTFPWTSEARGKAHVHVVIVGFGHGEPADDKRIHDYDGKGEPLGVAEVANISPYLTDGSDTAVVSRSKPLCDVPEIGIGNKPIDGGYYLFKPEEKAAFLKEEPTAEPYFRRWYGAQEFLQGIERWCLWVGDASPEMLRTMPAVLDRIEKVRQVRLASPSKPTQKLAATPTRFHVENMPSLTFLVIPENSSSNRDYIPLALMEPEHLASNKLRIFVDATNYHFGVMQSAMHMAWVNQVSGRIKSDYQWSVTLVYNCFPWPEPTDKQRESVEAAAQAVLDARAKYQSSGVTSGGLSGGVTLADLYDPLTMPADLAKAHGALDRAVDRCYRSQPFPDERRRFEHLFERYESLVAPLTGSGKRKKRA